MGRDNEVGGAGKRKPTASGQPPLRPLPKEKEKRKRAPDDSLEAPPPLALDLDRAGGKEAPPDKTQGAPRDPSCLPCPPKGREEEGEVEVPGSETPKEVSARGEVGGAVGTEPEGREDFLRLVSTLLYKLFPLSRRPNSTNVTKHVTGANITPTPSTSGVGVSIDK